MYFIYTVFLIAGLAIAAPYYLIYLGRYRAAIGERMGRLNAPRLQQSIWVHAVSVGEVNAVQVLLQRLRAAYPGRPLLLSTVTPAGRQLAGERKGIVDYAFYFPFDLPWVVGRVLDRLDPELVIVAETEIWPNFLKACKERGIHVLMVNGRISDRSLPRYRMIRAWLKRVLDNYTHLGMQSEIDRERIRALGADPAKITVFGNLKYDALAASAPLETTLADELAARKPLWIAASTKEGEEEFVLDAFADLKPRHAGLTLLIAPRHPQRFDEVERRITARGLECMRRSALNETRKAGAGAATARVILLDTIGELAGAFAYADVVFVGGSLVPRGGHNVLEPARFSRPIVFGPHMENFREMSQLFLDAQAAVQVQDPAGLTAAIGAILSNPKYAADLGKKARQIVERNAGATDRVMAYLQPAEARR